MGLLSFFKKKSKPKEVVQGFSLPYKIRGTYDAAQPSNELDNIWSQASSGTFDSIATPAVRKKLRDRSRYEVSNNSFAIGIVRTLVNDTIGTGAKLQVQTGDDALNLEIEQSFRQWAKDIALTEKLQIARKSRIESGEVFLVKTDNPKSKNPVQFDVELLESEYISSPIIKYSSEMVNEDIDGVQIDSFGNITGYTLCVNGNYSQLDPDNVIQYIRKDRPQQWRGVPEITQALPLFAMQRRFAIAVLGAAETAADFSAVLHTDGGAGDEDIEAGSAFETMDIEKRMMTTLPYAYKLTQLKAEQPTTTYTEYTKAIINQLAHTFTMPFIIAYGDSSDANYSSGRLDFQRYFKSIRVERQLIENQILNNVLSTWFNEARLINPGWSRYENALELNAIWYWDGFEHVDPKKEAEAMSILRANNLVTDKEIFASKGQDYEVQYAQIAREKEMREALNIQQEVDEIMEVEEE